MEIRRAIEIMEIERRCTELATTGSCDRNCVFCDLVTSGKELLEAYGYVIRELERHAKCQSNN
jgi:wyosine [tRNA(Phe)-imidazoG37] synthetase (radical SAM superfamily)